MKRVIVNIAVLVIGGGTLAAVLLLFFADNAFTRAQALEKAYRWTAAKESYERAIRLDPLNAEYRAGYGEFLIRKSKYQKDPAPYLKTAGDCYRRALGLNRCSAEYRVRLGELATARCQWLKAHGGSPEDVRREKETAMKNFTAAYDNDPKGFLTLYEAGYTALSLWDLLDRAERRMVTDMLRTALLSSMWHDGYIYAAVWKNTQDFNVIKEIVPQTLAGYTKLYGFITGANLWQFRKDVAAELERYRRKEQSAEWRQAEDRSRENMRELKEAFLKESPSPEITTMIPQDRWQGGDPTGKAAFEHQLMYWNGTLSAVVNMKPGKAAIQIMARKFLVIAAADTAKPQYFPYMIVTLDNESIGETFVANDRWQPYSFHVETDGGIKVLGIEFVNDFYDPKKGLDRNLAIGDGEIIYEQ
ncbi:MAG: carbohydrate-binding domain-containing protein [Candidatus Omnitrophica bacterium]|nr:carbohydrate-binding domain-containing protein [Candidatus Omnitrophota bacterium]